MRVLVRESEFDAGRVELHVFTDTGFKLVPATKENDRFPDPGYEPFAVEEVPNRVSYAADEPDHLGPVLGEPTLTLPRDVYEAIAR